MRRSFRCVNAIALAVVIGLSACADQQTSFGPEVASPEVSGPFFSHQPAAGFSVLRWTSPLERSVTITRTVGRRGGKIKLKEVGIVLDIPKRALDAKTEITITAPAGDAVAFTFSPYGLRFLKPATIRLDVEGTTAEEAFEHFLESRKSQKSRKNDEGGESPVSLDAFLGVYSVGDLFNGVQPLEILETFLDDDKIAFQIGHFSGYAVAGA